MRRAGRRTRALSVGLATLAGLAVLLWREGRLACGEPRLDTTSPNRAWTLRVCRRPTLLAMPGGSSDARGRIMLRESEAAIHGIVHRDMMQLLGKAYGDPVWERGEVVLPGLASLPLAHADGPVSRWFADRVWHLRALTGLVPSDAISAQRARR